MKGMMLYQIGVFKFCLLLVKLNQQLCRGSYEFGVSYLRLARAMTISHPLLQVGDLLRLWLSASSGLLDDLLTAASTSV
jgi:hypothetical protein